MNHVGQALSISDVLLEYSLHGSMPVAGWKHSQPETRATDAAGLGAWGDRCCQTRDSCHSHGRKTGRQRPQPSGHLLLPQPLLHERNGGESHGRLPCPLWVLTGHDVTWLMDKETIRIQVNGC